MSTHNICFYGEIRKISILLDWKKCIVSSAVARDITNFVKRGNEIVFLCKIVCLPYLDRLAMVDNTSSSPSHF